MTLTEFSTEFDILYNNITSNQAPGLNEYEKSVFLTKALDELIKAYFSPMLNKTSQGFDGSERRQIDFSNIVETRTYKEGSITALGKLLRFDTPEFDNREPNKIVPLIDWDRTTSDFKNLPILMILNEHVNVERKVSKTSAALKVRLTIIPVTYTLLTGLLSKPSSRPSRYSAWRLIHSYNSTMELHISNPIKGAELIVGSNDTIIDYTIRYVRKPNPIILEDLSRDGLYIDGIQSVSECELDPIIHRELVQRAVELAKATYQGSLADLIGLGVTSHTPLGVSSSGNNERRQ